ncbi:MAG: PilZ domain-containing protein [Candidatus Omnitrophica bacterium]|nr:PilZ domain-containing protein [Candidatus Omnitrophota bacterium]
MMRKGFFLATALAVGMLILKSQSALGVTESKSSESTRVVINTSGPMIYRHFYQSDPPKIVFRFFESSVYSNIPSSVPIQRGMVKGIEATYFRSYPLLGAKKPLKTLTFNLLAKTTYEVFEGSKSIVLVIRHPKEIPGSDLITGKVMLTTLPVEGSQEYKREEILAGAFQEAMAKMTAPPLTLMRMTPLSPPHRTETRRSEVPQRSRATASTWHKTPSFVLFFLILGGVLWPLSWFLMRKRLLQEKQQSWDMAKRIIALKEEGVSREERFSKELDALRNSHLKVQEETKMLLEERSKLRREVETRTVYLEEMASERAGLSDRLRVLQGELNEKMTLQEDLLKELREVSTRLNQEVSQRRELENVLEEMKHQPLEEIREKEVGEERRQWTRLPILPIERRGLPLTVEVQGPQGRLLYGYPKNVSCGGISFELKENVELPSPLSLKLLFPKRKSSLETQGKVVWKINEENASHYGISFMDLSQEGSSLIGQFVTEKLPYMREVRRTLEEFLREEVSGKPVVFGFEGPSAKSVSLVGDFNDWDPQANPMRRTKNGAWKLTLSLPPGSYQYQFYVDGVWQADPSGQSRVTNPFGGENTVLEVS